MNIHRHIAVVRHTLFLLLSLLLMQTVWAQPVATSGPKTNAVTIHDQFAEHKIGLMLDIFEDPSTALKLDDIRSPKYADKLSNSNQANPNFGYTSSAIWARFSLHDTRTPTQAKPLYLTLAYAATDLAELWCSNNAGTLVLQQRAGDHVPRAEWPSMHREPVFVINLPVQTCWLRVQSSASMQLPLTLRSQDAFSQAQVIDTAVQALYLGALAAMIIYNGLVALSTRSRAYASYTLFLSSFGLFHVTFSGLGYALLWPQMVAVLDPLAPMFVGLIGVTSILFAMVLLNVQKESPRWFKLGALLFIYYFIASIMVWFLPYSTAMISVLGPVPLWAVFLLGSGITLARRGVRVAKIYLVAWSVFITGTFILAAHRLGYLPANAFTVNTQLIGSVIEFILLSFALSDRIKTLQKTLLQTQNNLLESMRAESAAQAQTFLAQSLMAQSQSEALLAKAQNEVQLAHNAALQVQAELSRKEAEHAQKEAEFAQNQLQQADKMASLGQLVASVTHEINTPIGAINSSGQSITEALTDVAQQLPPLLQQLDAHCSQLLVQLLLQTNQPKPAMSSREERVLVKSTTELLDQAGVEQGRQKAALLVNLSAHKEVEKYLPLLQHSQSDAILEAVRNFASAQGNARNVNIAVERVIKIVKALKSFSHFNVGTEKIEANLVEGMETVLTIYQGQTKVGVEVVRNYEDIPPLICFPDELNQVWTNLIHNALQAMNHEGTLTIGILQDGNNAVVSVGDSGCGIPEEIRSKIFDVFFTTKPAGVGSGLGLDIVKKIVDKHHGRIELQSEVGVGTTFKVVLPYIVDKAK